MEYRLQEMFKKQAELMTRLGLKVRTNKDLVLLKPEEQQELTEETVVLAFALQDEVHEFVRELNWKPWKQTKKEVNVEAVQKELIDAWHFLIELSLMWGLNSDNVHDMYLQKNQENHQRQDKGY